MRPGGGSTTRRTVAAWGAAAVAALGALALAATEPDPEPVSPPAPTSAGELPDAPGTLALPPRGQRPAAPAAVLTSTPDGDGLLWTERGTGVVLRAPVAAGRVGAPTVLARLQVAPGPEHGVRGLAVGAGGRVYAAYVEARDARLVVAEISRPRPRLLWRGPRAGRVRVGGGLVALRGGRLALAVGDQARPLAADRPGSVLGRVLTLDPANPAPQEPRRRSRGWHDPAAFALGRGGALWVADRAGDGAGERTGRADRPRAGAVRSGVRRAPVALAAADGGRVLFACGLRSGRVDRTLVRGGGTGSARSEPQVLDARCRYGIAVVGGTVFASGDDGRISAVGAVDELRAASVIRP
jgi:glucose/arabinose dehydrogenase